MKSTRHPWLIVLLIFWLPVQALAAVLIECEQHLAESPITPVAAVTSSPDNGHQHTQPAAADCHGVDREATSATESADQTSHANAGSTSCFHCSGVCQSLKPLNLIAINQAAPMFDNGAFSHLEQAPAEGVRSNPARPPCPTVLT